MGNTEFPRLSEKEFLIMKLLVSKGKEMYGLEMVDKSEGLLKRGTIYVTLGRLEDKGFVESKQEPQAPGIATPRRLYRTTGLGVKVFRALELAGGAAWLKGAMA